MEMSKPNAKQTLVEEGTELKGTLKSSCQVVVNGSIDGQIEAPALTISHSGTVLGSVKVTKLRSEGTLAGSIDADDVYLSGTVRSNTMIRASKLEVKLTQERGKLEVTFGECLLDVGEDPAKATQQDSNVKPASASVAVPVPVPVPVPAAAPAPFPVAEASWSDRPGATPEDNPSAPASAAGDADAGEIADAAGGPKDANGRRTKKNPDRRDSQIPPA
jgi:cytoskeletal protein CcmA (bactofilin family)